MRVSNKQIYQAYKKCHKGKAKTTKAQLYSAKLIDHLFDTHWALQTNNYKPKPYKFAQFPWLNLFFYKNNDVYLSTAYSKFASKFKHQVDFFNSVFNGFIVIIQKGKNFIINSVKDQEFNLKQLSTTFNKLQNNNTNTVFISECGFVHNRLKQRKVRQIFINNQIFATLSALQKPTPKEYLC